MKQPQEGKVDIQTIQRHLLRMKNVAFFVFHPESFCVQILGTWKVFAFLTPVLWTQFFSDCRILRHRICNLNGFTTWWFLGRLQTEFWLILIIDLPPPLTILPDKVPFEDWYFQPKQARESLEAGYTFGKIYFNGQQLGNKYKYSCTNTNTN